MPSYIRDRRKLLRQRMGLEEKDKRKVRGSSGKIADLLNYRPRGAQVQVHHPFPFDNW